MGGVGSIEQRMREGLESAHNNGSTIIQFSNMGLHDNDMFTLRDFLVRNDSVIELVLAGNKLTDRGAQTLMDGLLTNTSVMHLKLTGNQITRKMGNIVKSFMGTKLAILNVNKRGGTVLDLRRNRIEENSTLLIKDFIAENKVVATINLHENDLGAGGVEILAWALKANDTVTNVNLYHNKIGAQGATFVAAVLTTPTSALTHLNLYRNHLRDKGAEVLFKALEDNKRIKSLLMGQNDIKHKGAKAAGKMLAVNTTLVQLDLFANRIDDGGACAIADGLTKNKTLRVISMSRNMIGLDGVKEFEKMMRANSSVQSLDLGTSQSDTNEVKDLVKIIEKKMAANRHQWEEEKIQRMERKLRSTAPLRQRTRFPIIDPSKEVKMSPHMKRALYRHRRHTIDRAKGIRLAEDVATIAKTIQTATHDNASRPRTSMELNRAANRKAHERMEHYQKQSSPDAAAPNNGAGVGPLGGRLQTPPPSGSDDAAGSESGTASKTIRKLRGSAASDHTPPSSVRSTSVRMKKQMNRQSSHTALRNVLITSQGGSIDVMEGHKAMQYIGGAEMANDPEKPPSDVSTSSKPGSRLNCGSGSESQPAVAFHEGTIAETTHAHVPVVSSPTTADGPDSPAAVGLDPRKRRWTFGSLRFTPKGKGKSKASEQPRAASHRPIHRHKKTASDELVYPMDDSPVQGYDVIERIRSSEESVEPMELVKEDQKGEVAV